MRLILWIPVIIAVGGVAYLSFFIWSLNHLPKKTTENIVKANVREATDVVSLGANDDVAFAPCVDLDRISVATKQNNISTPVIKIVKSELIIANSGQKLWDELSDEHLQFFQLAKYEEPIFIGNQVEVN